MTDKYGRSKKYNRVYGDGIKTPTGRFSWPSLVEPKAPPPPKPGENPGQPRYEVQLVIAKDAPDLKEFAEQMKVMSGEMVEQYNRHAVKLNLAKLHPDIAIVQDGDQMDHEKYPYYKNSYILTARNTEMPKLYDAQKSAIGAANIQAGQFGRLVVVPHLGPTGLSYRLEILQLLEDDGTRFGGGKRDYDNFLDDISGGSDSTSDSESQNGGEEEPDAEENGNDESTPEQPPVVPKNTAPQLVVDPKAMRERAAAAVKEKAKANKTIGAGGKGGPGKQAAIDLL